MDVIVNVWMCDWHRHGTTLSPSCWWLLNRTFFSKTTRQSRIKKKENNQNENRIIKHRKINSFIRKNIETLDVFSTSWCAMWAFRVHALTANLILTARWTFEHFKNIWLHIGLIHNYWYPFEVRFAKSMNTECPHNARIRSPGRDKNAIYRNNKYVRRFSSWNVNTHDIGTYGHHPARASEEENGDNCDFLIHFNFSLCPSVMWRTCNPILDIPDPDFQTNSVEKICWLSGESMFSVFLLRKQCDLLTCFDHF